MLYRPVTLLPDDLESLCDQLDREHNTIAQVFNLQDFVKLEETNVAPEKPRAGEVRYADGTNWNPGSGIGIYAYYSGTWNKL